MRPVICALFVAFVRFLRFPRLVTLPAGLGGGTQMRELLADLFRCQDAPDGNPRRVWAVALPPLRVLVCRRRIRMVALKAMALSPDLNAVFAPFGRRLRITDPAALSTHCGPCCVARQVPSSA